MKQLNTQNTGRQRQQQGNSGNCGSNTSKHSNENYIPGIHACGCLAISMCDKGNKDMDIVCSTAMYIRSYVQAYCRARKCTLRLNESNFDEIRNGTLIVGGEMARSVMNMTAETDYVPKKW